MWRSGGSLEAAGVCGKGEGERQQGCVLKKKTGERGAEEEAPRCGAGMVAHSGD